MIKKAMVRTNTWFLITIGVSLLLTPLDLLLNQKSSFGDFFVSWFGQGFHNFIGESIVILLLWWVFFLVILFFYWLNHEMSKKDYHNR